MTDELKPRPLPAKRAGLGFGSGLVIGILIGVVVGVMIGAGGANTTTGRPIAAAGANAEAPHADSSPTLTITLGRPRSEGEYLVFPTTILNNTGEVASYLQGDCSFYSKDGTLLSHAMTNMTNVPSGARGSNDLMVEGTRLSEIDHYECTASGH